MARLASVTIVLVMVEVISTSLVDVASWVVSAVKSVLVVLVASMISVWVVWRVVDDVTLQIESARLFR